MPFVLIIVIMGSFNWRGLVKPSDISPPHVSDRIDTNFSLTVGVAGARSKLVSGENVHSNPTVRVVASTPLSEVAIKSLMPIAATRSLSHGKRVCLFYSVQGPIQSPGLKGICGPTVRVE